MPDDRLAERLALARRLATEARLDRLDELLTGLRADAVTDGGVPADLEVELAVLRASALMNVERAGEAWDHLQGVQGRPAEASPAAQARFHAAAGTTAYWFGDHDSAIDEVVLALAVLAGEPPTATGALALAASGLVLAYTRLFPLAAEVMTQALATAGEVGLPAARIHSQAQYVQLTWGMSVDHLGLHEQCRQRWAEVERHHRLATADPAALPDSMLALSHAERALLAGRLGDAGTGREFLGRARAVRAEGRSPSLRRLLAHAEGAVLAAEGRTGEARRVLLELWESVQHRAVPARTEDVPLLLARLEEAAGRLPEALQWYRELYGRYGRTQQESWQTRETAARLRVEQEALVRRSRELEADSLTDPLTGLPNRRAFDAGFAELVPAAQAVGSPLTLVVLDVDRFKRINDRYGHPVGDEVLRTVGRIVGERSLDRVGCARYGGDEFVLSLPVPAVAARELVADIVAAVAGHPWSALAAGLRVSISCGSAELGPTDTATTVFYSADQELLAAKRAVRHSQAVSAWPARGYRTARTVEG
ncbi:MAG: GGDEF domain-containing protein [Mycobacteriales bacterium]